MTVESIQKCAIIKELWWYIGDARASAGGLRLREWSEHDPFKNGGTDLFDGSLNDGVNDEVRFWYLDVLL
jgi:hypothetical protein